MFDRDYRPYQLPSLYDAYRFKNRRRLFLFKTTTEASVRAAVALIAANPAIEYVDVRCAKEFTDAQRDRIKAIFEELIPAARDIEIVFDMDIPEKILRTWFKTICQESSVQKSILS